MKCENAKLQNLIKLADSLSAERLDKIIDELYSKLANELNVKDESVYTLNSDRVTFCKKCGSINFVKNGKDRNGHTRFKCKDCNSTFSQLEGTVVFGTHKKASVWKKYISLMLKGGTIAECAKECSISPTTAFVWRHKILNALTTRAFSDCFNGVIEMDEMYMRISYKGNHKKSKNFSMPRQSFKRGSDNRIPGNNSKASILCIVERNKGFSAIIPCRGTINKPLLQDIFEEKISNESIVLTDGLRAYNQYFTTTDIEHIVLASNNGKPTVSGPYHINNVNAMQRRFRRFIADYNGVSTKYLNNYLALFLWIENNKYFNKNDLLVEELNQVGSYVPATYFSTMAPIPALPPAA